MITKKATQLAVVTTNDGISKPTTVWYDAFGRELRTESPLNDNLVKVDRTYTTRGQVSEPYYSGTPKFTTYAYYNNGRVRSVTSPHGDATSYAYSVSGYKGLKTITTTPRGKHTSEANALGQVVRSTDNSGATVEHKYYASGLPKQSLPSGGGADGVQMAYDKFGNRTKLIDPNTGTVTSITNPLGELIETTDNRNNTTVYSYDNAGRLEVITCADDVTTNVYDNLGRLKSVTLDSFGKVKHKQEYIYKINSWTCYICLDNELSF